MRKLFSLISLVAIVVGINAYATLRVAEPQTLNEIVETSTLIVKGSMKPVRAFGFWGYNPDGSHATIEQRMEELIAPREVLEVIGGRTVDFEITVTEQMKGERDTKEPIIVRISTPELTNYYEETPESQRIFFLVRNHALDPSYGVMSLSGILDETPDGRYAYPLLNDSSAGITQWLPPQYLGFDDTVVEVFDNLVRQRVTAQR